MPVRRAGAILALCMLPCAATRAGAPPHPFAPPPQSTTPTAAEIRAAVRPPALEEAVRTALVETTESSSETPKTRFGADARKAFERQFSEAKVPYCLHGDGLKRQSTFFLSGYVALPFVLVARARSKCLF